MILIIIGCKDVTWLLTKEGLRPVSDPFHIWISYDKTKR